MNYLDPKEALKKLLFVKKNNFNYSLKKKDIAKFSGINEATLYRHLNGCSPISRNSAINYAKVLDCDPVEILFKKI